MKIVILDNATLGNDVDLSQLKNEGELTVFETTQKHEINERIKEVDIIITNKVPIGKEELEVAGKLKLICVAATGYNIIDVAEATKKNVFVANVKGYSTNSVAQLVFTYILAIQNSIIDFNNDVKNGKWNNWPVFTMLNHSFTELYDKKIGIIGYGAIGKKVAEIAKAFGMQVIIAKREGVKYNDNNRVDLKTLFSQSDIITVHVPLTDATKNLISNEEFGLMKNEAILINTARGGVVNENDLYKALKEKRIKFAGVDVFTTEPPRSGNQLFELDNIIVTPHIAWTSKEARIRLVQGLVNNIKKFKEGKADEIKVN